MRMSRKNISAYLFIFFALVISGYALSYYWHSDNPFNSRYHALSALGRYSHFIGGGCALLFGVLQLFVSVGSPLHRLYGYAYCLSVIAGAGGGFYLAIHSYLGMSTGVGFLLLDALWIATTACAIYHIRLGKVELHRRWILRSMALTSAAISLRILLPLFNIVLPFDTSYLLAAWLCWILNLIGLEIFWYVSRPNSPLPIKLYY